MPPKRDLAPEIAKVPPISEQQRDSAIRAVRRYAGDDGKALADLLAALGLSADGVVLTVHERGATRKVST